MSEVVFGARVFGGFLERCEEIAPEKEHFKRGIKGSPGEFIKAGKGSGSVP